MLSMDRPAPVRLAMAILAVGWKWKRIGQLLGHHCRRPNEVRELFQFKARSIQKHVHWTDSSHSMSPTNSLDNLVNELESRCQFTPYHVPVPLSASAVTGLSRLLALALFNSIFYTGSQPT